MDFVFWLMELVGSVLSVPLSILNSLLLEPVVEDPAQRAGFWRGMVSAGIIGIMAREFLYRWSRFSRLFQPSKAPATNSGPTPARTFVECVGSLLVLAIFLILFTLATVRVIAGGA